MVDSIDKAMALVCEDMPKPVMPQFLGHAIRRAPLSSLSPAILPRWRRMAITLRGAAGGEPSDCFPALRHTEG